MSGTRTFVAMREDGLGERLKALINAMVIADLAGGQFAFQWRPMATTNLPFHDVLPPEEMFDQSFLDRHLKSNLGSIVVTLASQAAEILSGGPGNGEFVRIDQNDFNGDLKDANKIFDLKGRFA